jgi:hypothetical protein
MAQINKGYNYTTSGANSYVTAGNLNQHVALATLAGGAISEQAANSSSNDTDIILIGTGTGLSTAIWKQTKAQFTNTINSASISVNALSVQDAELDSITINGSYDDEVYFNVGNAAIYNSSTTSPYVMFGYDNITHALPVGHTGNVFRHHGISTLFTDPYNPVDLNVAGTGHTVTIAGDLIAQKNLTVTKGVTIAGRELMNSTLAIKAGNCFAGGINTFLMETQLLDIPSDETWIFEFSAYWRYTGNPATAVGYQIKVDAIKATYADVNIATKNVIPVITGNVNTSRFEAKILLMLTTSNLANLTKSLKFYTTTPPSGATIDTSTDYNEYTIRLTKVKTTQFNSDISIL